jgi:molecular chaperone DnaK (HSP70)
VCHTPLEVGKTFLAMERSETRTLQSLLTSIQVDHTFKSHLKDPEILLSVCQSLIQKFPDQAKDLHILMIRENGISQEMHHKVIPDYVNFKIQMVTDLCETLQIPFPLHSLHPTELAPPLTLTEEFFRLNSLQYSVPYDYAVGLDIGGSNACISVYHSATGVIEPIPDSHSSMQFPIKGLDYLKILKLSKAHAEKFLKHPIWKIFVCLPLDATIIDRLKLRHAAVQCNLELLGTSNSPQLTAFSYGTHVNTEHSVVICDIGAKSVDIGYFLIEDGFVEVKSVDFNDSLGLNVLDNLLFHHYQKELTARFSTQLSEDPFSTAHLMTLCENLKIHLSTNESSEMICHSVMDTLHYKKSLSRTEFQEICSSYFLQLEQWLLYLFTSQFPSTTVDEILLIGGGSQIPAMKSIFRNYFKNPLEGDVLKEVQVGNEDYSGVKGAALLAAIRSHILPSEHNLSQSLLVDVTTHEISLIIAEGMQSVIVSRCTSIPLVKSQVYATTYDNQTAALLHVVESIREDEEEGKGISRSMTIGWFIIEDLPARPAGEVKVSVVIDVSSSYEVKVTAQEMDSGIMKSVVMALNRSDEITPLPVYLNPQKLYLEHCPA